MNSKVVAREVWCTTSFIGYHQWVDAPDEVKHLAFPHRHKFNVKVAVTVDHNERATEFQLLKKDTDSVITTLNMFSCDTVSPRSCESIAEHIGLTLRDLFLYSVERVMVDEDGENGVVLYFD